MEYLLSRIRAIKYLTESIRKRQMIDIDTFPLRFNLVMFCSEFDCASILK